MKKKMKKSENRGYSLIELVVTILISSVVMVAVVGFLSTGLRHYRNVNSETMLQMESQVAELFLTELFQESRDFHEIDASAYPIGVSYAAEITRDAEYILLLKDGELLFSKVTGGTDSERITNALSKDRSETFLAQYVKSIDIFGDNTTFAEVAGSHGLMSLNVEFEVDKKSYESNMLISLRNAKRN